MIDLQALVKAPATSELQLVCRFYALLKVLYYLGILWQCSKPDCTSTILRWLA
jgi:hypothetical protein